MKLKHQTVRVQQNKQGLQQQQQQRSKPELAQSEHQPNNQPAVHAEAAGNNQSHPDETVDSHLEPPQLSNHQGQQPGSSSQQYGSVGSPRHYKPQIQQTLMGQMPISSKRSKQNFMQQQNRPLQKGKGKRIFLEMRDSQLVQSSSDPALGLQQAVSVTLQGNTNLNKVISSSNTVNKDRSPNPQLQQKEIGNSREDSMLQLDSDNNEQQTPYAQTAIHELRQLSARKMQNNEKQSYEMLAHSDSHRRNQQLQAQSAPSQDQQYVYMSSASGYQVPSSSSYLQGQNMSQAGIPNHEEGDPEVESYGYASQQQANKPVGGEGQMKLTNGNHRLIKRQSTNEVIAASDQRQANSVRSNQVDQTNSVGHGSAKVSHPGTNRVLLSSGGINTTGSVFISYEKLAKAVDAMTKQITIKHELILKDRGFSIVPEALRFQCQTFEQLIVLDLQNNNLTELDGDFCQNFPCLEKLDLRNNKLKSINPHIKALMSLQILRLDNNQLTQLVPQIGNLKLLQELTVSNNKLFEIPHNFGENLTSLHTLNVADNQIKSLPASLGNLGQYNLKHLFLHGNNFTSFPSTFVHMCNLEELSLEWFLYVKPSKPKLVRRQTEDGRVVFESMEQLFNLLMRHEMDECMFIIFLEYYSEEQFEPNHKDNRQRTPLHNAAAKGDNGVLEGLLQGNADPNILDKDNCTPLCLAIRDEKFAAAQILIESEEVDVNMGGGIYGSPLHLAVVKLEIWLIKALIKKGADVNKTDCDGKTALHFVMNLFSKNPQKCQYIAETLVLNGAKPNLKDIDNWTPLHTAVRKGQDKGVAAIAKLNKQLVDKEKFDMNATGGVHKWTALHLAAHGGHLNICRDLLRAGADIFQRNTNNQLPRHCAKGNYILTKFIKMAEQSRTSLVYNTYFIENQFQLIRGLTMRKPDEFKQSQTATGTPQPINKMIKGYNNLVSSLKLVRKHRPFAENDNLPKICQPEDHIEVSSPRSSTSSDDQDNQAMIDAEEEGSPFKVPMQLDRSQLIGKCADPVAKQDEDNSPQVDAEGNLIQLFGASSKAEVMGPNCNLKSILTDQELKNKGGDRQLSNTDRFQRLSALAEERKVNLFYLKDTIFSKEASMLEKLDAMAQIRRNVHLPVFKFAIETTLTKFHQIPERSLQLELISIIGKSQQSDLLRGLQKLLVCNVKNLQTDVADEIEEAICELKASSKKMTKAVQPLGVQVSKGFNRVRNVSSSGQGLPYSQQVSSVGVTTPSQAPSPHPKSVQPPMVGGGNNQSVLGMSVHSQNEVSPRTAQNQARKLGHPGAVIRDNANFECSSNEDTIKRSGTMFEFQKPVVHAGLSSVQGSSSLASGSIGPPNHQSSSSVMQPGITRQTIICDNPSPVITNCKSKARGIPSTLVLSESKFVIPPSTNGYMMEGANSMVTGSAHFGRIKQINPSNKVVSKQNMMAQSVEHNMSSSLISSSNVQHEEDISSSHVDTDQPNKMSINPSLTQSVAGVQRDTAKQELEEEFKSRAAAPIDSFERPNLPRISQKVNKQSQQVGHSSAYHHPGLAKASFTNSINVSIGSMSDSLNARFQLKNTTAQAKR